jgi:hypothetical protein
LIALFLSQFFVQFVQLRVFLPDYLPVAQTLVPARHQHLTTQI